MARFNGGVQFGANNIMGRDNEDSGSENYDVFSVEETAEGSAPNTKNKNNNNNKKKKKDHRHTPQQIEELENLFKTCGHPDEKQRFEIGRRLGLESKQVQFWFQNRRTQHKMVNQAQIEHQENVDLKQIFDKLKFENGAMKKALTNLMCSTCGDRAKIGDVTMEHHHLKVENARLKSELFQARAVIERFLGKPLSDLMGPISFPTSDAGLQVSVDKQGVNGIISSPSALPKDVDLEQGGSSNSTFLTTSIIGAVSTMYEKNMYMKTAMGAMDELLDMAKTNYPLWFKALEDGKEVLNEVEYLKRFSGLMGMRADEFVSDASRETGSVYITSLAFMETMMTPRQWQELFPCMVSKASTVEVLFPGNNGTRDGELQLMSAEFVFPSALVPFRPAKILRFCKQHSEGMWALVDVSADMIQEASTSVAPIKWRRRPSGCIIQDVGNGYSLITWIEHLEYDENYVPQLYRPVMRSGMGFGALRWLATLQRECDCACIFMTAKIFPSDDTVVTLEGRKSILKLMRRLSINFCSGLCPSSACHWEKLKVVGLSADVCFITRVSVDDPGEPSGVVLSVSTSVWMPLPRQHLFDFLRDEKVRGKWDVLANGGPMEVIVRLSKSHDGSNCVTLLCPPMAPAEESDMLILQESWSDRTGSFIVYGPVHSSLMERVLKGGDSDHMAVLPSGFSICDAPINPNVVMLGNSNIGGASVLTLGFQILIDGTPTAKFTVESMNTVNSLISCTMQKIRASLGIIN